MKEKRRQVFMALGLVWMLLVFAFTVAAQDKAADNMQILREKVRADKTLLVAEGMQLTEGESKTFWPVYEAYQNELFLLRERALRLIKDYAGAYEKMTDATAKRLVDEYLAIETLQLKLRRAYLPRFRKALPEMKVMRYYQIENKVQAVLSYELARSIPLAMTDQKQQ